MGKRQRAGRDALCDTYSPTLPWGVLVQLSGSPGGTPVTLTLSPSSTPALRWGNTDLEVELPSSVPTPVCPCRAGDQALAELPSPGLSCHCVWVGHGECRHMALEAGRPLHLHPVGQADTQPCCGTTHRRTSAAARVTMGSSMSPSPRCSAASLVNWESEMKHCSSGREELRTLGTSGTPPPTGISDARRGDPWLQGRAHPKAAESNGDRRVRRFLLAADGPSRLLRTPGPVLGTSERGHTEMWPCAAGEQQGPPPATHGS